MPLHVGTSGWAYTAWKPGFYPPKLPSRKFLEFYSSRLNAVEVNYTFRRLLSQATISGWLAQTPPHFQFAIKAHQTLTHMRRLKNVDEPLRLFLDSLDPLKKAKRLGPILFQLPPNFKQDGERLSAFLKLLPRSLLVAFEFRHESWFNEETYDVLRKGGAALCIAETDEFQTPEVFTSSFAYFRLRRSTYSPRGRKAIAKEMSGHGRQMKDVYAFFKHEENPKSPNWADELLAAAQPGELSRKISAPARQQGRT